MTPSGSSRLAFCLSALGAEAQTPAPRAPAASDSARLQPADAAAHLSQADPPASSALRRWLATGVHIRQNNNVMTEVAQPVFLQLTWPADAPRTLVAGIGALLDLPAGRLNNAALAPSLAFEYARNTTLKKEQAVFRAGVSATWLPLAAVAPTPAVRPIVIAQAAYKHNAIRQDEAVQASALVTAIAYFRNPQTGQCVTIFNATLTDRSKRYFFLVLVGLSLAYLGEKTPPGA